MNVMNVRMVALVIALGSAGCGSGDGSEAVTQAIRRSGAEPVRAELATSQQSTTLAIAPVPLVTEPVVVAESMPNRPRASVATPVPASGVTDVTRQPAITPQTF